MSLDLFLTRKTPVQRTGTGVYVRKNGSTAELKTIEEVRHHFPDADLSEIQEQQYETDEVFCRNITHNLTTMASHIPCSPAYSLYDLLWRPEEHGFAIVTSEYRRLVSSGLAYMLSNRKSLEQYNPTNGWGSYDNLLEFVYSYCESLSCIEDSDEVEITADR